MNCGKEECLPYRLLKEKVGVLEKKEEQLRELKDFIDWHIEALEVQISKFKRMDNGKKTTKNN